MTVKTVWMRRKVKIVCLAFSAMLSLGALRTEAAVMAGVSERIATEIETTTKETKVTAGVSFTFAQGIKDSSKQVAKLQKEAERVLVAQKEAEIVRSPYEDQGVSNVEVGSCVNVRSGPSVEEQVVGKLYDNSKFTVMDFDGEWYLIRSGNCIGYVKSQFVVVGEEERILSAGDRVAETVEEERVRLEAEAEAERQRQEAEEAARRAAEEAARAAEEARRQAAAKKYNPPQGVSGQSVVDYACQFVGNPYVYGGESLTNGADCSGFVKAVYAAFGVTLPHSSYELRFVGYEVSPYEMQPGDIICYSGHVGIYVGNNTIVHASTQATGIKYTSPANYRTIITVRRIF